MAYFTPEKQILPNKVKLIITDLKSLITILVEYYEGIKDIKLWKYTKWYWCC